MAVHKTAITIDDELAVAARRVLGTRTLTATVDAALRSVVEGARRRRHVELLAELGPDLVVARAEAWERELPDR